MILICGCENIFCSSIKALLSIKTGWEIASVSSEEGWDALNLAMETVQPDTVIVHQESLDEPTSFVLRLLQDYPAIKVIVLSLENNLMDVYSKRNIFAESISNLFEAIENAPNSISG